MHLSPISFALLLLEINLEELDGLRKSISSSKKKSRPRRISESHRLRFRNDSVSSINSDDLDTSLDPEPLDWSDLVEKEESEMTQSLEKVSLVETSEAKEKIEKQNQWTKVLNNSKIHKTIQARLKVRQFLSICSGFTFFFLQFYDPLIEVVLKL